MTDLWKGELGLELESLTHVEQLVARVEKKLDQLSTASQPCQLLRTLPGVGQRLAEIAVAMLDDPRRFRSGKQVSSYVGLTPRQFQSGDQDRQGRMSHMGNNLLRALLVEVGWVGPRYNHWMRDVYERVRRGSPVRKKQAIVAVARRLTGKIDWDNTPIGETSEALPALPANRGFTANQLQILNSCEKS